jgi:hypothetical protein
MKRTSRRRDDRTFFLGLLLDVSLGRRSGLLPWVQEGVRTDTGKDEIMT